MEDLEQKYLAPMGSSNVPIIADKLSKFIELPGNVEKTYTYVRKDGKINFAACGYVDVGRKFTVGVLDDELNIVNSEEIVWVKNAKAYGDQRLNLLAMDEDKYGISNDGNYGACKLVCGDRFNTVRLYPSTATQESWWYAEGWFYPEYGGLIYLDPESGDAYLGVRIAYYIENPVNNSIIKFNYRVPYFNDPKVIQEEVVVKNVNSSGGFTFCMHRSPNKILHVITGSLEYQLYDTDLKLLGKRQMNPDIKGFMGFCVYNNVLVLLYRVNDNLRVDFRVMDENQTFIKSVAVNEFYRKNASCNTRIYYLKDGFFIQNGNRIFKIPATFS